jgi:hypothetical protein
MRELSPEVEKRLESLGWLQGASLRGVQVDVQKRDVAIFAQAKETLVEVLCEDVGYLALPDLFGHPELPRVVGMVAQPLDDAFVVRFEFSNHPGQIHLQCQRLTVRKDAAA